MIIYFRWHFGQSLERGKSWQRRSEQKYFLVEWQPPGSQNLSGFGSQNQLMFVHLFTISPCAPLHSTCFGPSYLEAMQYSYIMLSRSCWAPWGSKLNCTKTKQGFHDFLPCKGRPFCQIPNLPSDCFVTRALFNWTTLVEDLACSWSMKGGSPAGQSDTPVISGYRSAVATSPFQIFQNAWILPLAPNIMRSQAFFFGT